MSARFSRPRASILEISAATASQMILRASPLVMVLPLATLDALRNQMLRGSGRRPSIRMTSCFLAAAALAGWKGGEEDLAPLGRAILREKTAFKLAQGFSWDRLAIPARFLETPAPGRGLSEDFLRRGIAAYARLVSS